MFILINFISVFRPAQEERPRFFGNGPRYRGGAGRDWPARKAPAYFMRHSSTPPENWGWSFSSRRSAAVVTALKRTALN